VSVVRKGSIGRKVHNNYFKSINQIYKIISDAKKLTMIQSQLTIIFLDMKTHKNRWWRRPAPCCDSFSLVWNIGNILIILFNTHCRTHRQLHAVQLSSKKMLPSLSEASALHPSQRRRKTIESLSCFKLRSPTSSKKNILYRSNIDEDIEGILRELGNSNCDLKQTEGNAKEEDIAELLAKSPSSSKKESERINNDQSIEIEGILRELGNSSCDLEQTNGDAKQDEISGLLANTARLQEELAIILKDRDEKVATIRKLVLNLEHEKATHRELEEKVEKLENDTTELQKKLEVENVKSLGLLNELNETKGKMDELEALRGEELSEKTSDATINTEISKEKDVTSPELNNAAAPSSGQKGFSFLTRIKKKRGKASAGHEVVPEEKPSTLNQIDSLEASLEMADGKIEICESQSSGWAGQPVQAIAPLFACSAPMLRKYNSLRSELQEKSELLSCAEMTINMLKMNINQYGIELGGKSAQLKSALQQKESARNEVKDLEDSLKVSSNKQIKMKTRLKQAEEMVIKLQGSVESNTLKSEEKKASENIAALKRKISKLQISCDRICKERDLFRSKLIRLSKKVGKPLSPTAMEIIPNKTQDGTSISTMSSGSSSDQSADLSSIDQGGINEVGNEALIIARALVGPEKAAQLAAAFCHNGLH